LARVSKRKRLRRGAGAHIIRFIDMPLHVGPFDVGVYLAHVVFWLAFAAGDVYARRLARRSRAESATSPAAGEPTSAPHAGLLVFLHMVAFGVLYFGVGRAVFDTRTAGTAARRVIGAAIIVAGAGLTSWARVSFASWRFRAELAAGHQLATGGPFRFVRHPIYAGLDLLALGTAVWIGTLPVWIGAALMAVGGDLRARAEEPLLERVFGEEYRAYRARTSRFVPGVY
jgi:protein-S-isoprenylcysteine O-methyltransferase Ste14